MSSHTAELRGTAPQRGWRRAWMRAPRQLQTTREGKVVLGLAVAVGLAAVNTGSNLLLLGWGLVLSAIVISGILSEATLKPLELRGRAPREARVGEVAELPLQLRNSARRVPAFGVEAEAVLTPTPGAAPRAGAAAELRAAAEYQLRLEPGETRSLAASFVPRQRGLHRLTVLRAATAYPFGFFRKSRRYHDPELRFWVFPAAVPVDEILHSVTARLGQQHLPQRGASDEFFSLRPHRPDDDLRQVHWRRSARTGRWWVREHQALSGQQLILELAMPARFRDPAALEHGLAVAGSLAEALLARGHEVGLRAPGFLIAPASGRRQRLHILQALAQLEPDAPLPGLPRHLGAARLGLRIAGAAALPGCQLAIAVPPPAGPAPAARA